MSKLVNGKIPAKTKCPWKDKCSTARAGKCRHNGVEHAIPYSCGFARGFEICERVDTRPRIMDGFIDPSGRIVCVEMNRQDTPKRDSDPKIAFPEIRKVTVVNDKPRLHRN